MLKHTKIHLYATFFTRMRQVGPLREKVSRNLHRKHNAICKAGLWRTKQFFCNFINFSVSLSDKTHVKSQFISLPDSNTNCAVFGDCWKQAVTSGSRQPQN